MRDPNHARAQDLDVTASRLLSVGSRAEARALLREAADYEALALAAIPESKPKTRGVIGVSAVSLFYKAGRLVEAENLAYSLLAEKSIEGPFRAQLRELLEVVWDEQSLPSGMIYSGEEIVVSLRGGEVGYGTAPLEMALSKSAEIRNLIHRATEMLCGDEFRRRGPARKEVAEFVQARATQPSAGSYRFSIRLVEPEQMELFGREVSGRRATAKEVSDVVFGVVRTAVSSSPDATEKLKEIVPDADYRRALVKLVRNVVPSDAGLREVELLRVCPSKDGVENGRESVRLSKEARQSIADVVRGDEIPTVSMPADEPGLLQGILRALHLDAGWLLVATDEGERQRCETRGDVLDDVVGPMVNRRVVVRGVWTDGRAKFLVDDIELDVGV